MPEVRSRYDQLAENLAYRERGRDYARGGGWTAYLNRVHRDFATLERGGEPVGILPTGERRIGAHRSWRCPMIGVFIYLLKALTLKTRLTRLGKSPTTVDFVRNEGI